MLKCLKVGNNLAENLHNSRDFTELVKLDEFSKTSAKQFVEAKMPLRKANYNFLANKMDQTTPGLNAKYKQLSFVQRDYPKFFFRDDSTKKC